MSRARSSDPSAGSAAIVARTAGEVDAGSAVHSRLLVNRRADRRHHVVAVERARARRASRRARSRRPRCPRACRPVSRAPARGSCTRRCRASCRRRHRPVRRSSATSRARRRGARSRRRVEFGEPEVQHLHGAVGRTLMFAGFRSRWMIPWSCAASSASAICRAMASASSSGIAPALQPRGEIFTLDQLHDERRSVVGVLQPVDGRDLRVIRARQDLGFALKPRQPIAVGSRAPPAGS